MITNADITIYNRLYDKVNRLDIWKRTIVEGVSFYKDTKIGINENGATTEDVCKIRIPENHCDGYVPPEGYTGADGTWTIQNDDYIVKGVSDQEITRPIELKDAIRINSFSDNRRGSLPHLRIGGF